MVCARLTCIKSSQARKFHVLEALKETPVHPAALRAYVKNAFKPERDYCHPKNAYFTCLQYTRLRMSFPLT